MRAVLLLLMAGRRQPVAILFEMWNMRVVKLGGDEDERTAGRWR